MVEPFSFLAIAVTVAKVVGVYATGALFGAALVAKVNHNARQRELLELRGEFADDKKEV